MKTDLSLPLHYIYCTMNLKHFYQPGTFKTQKVNSAQNFYYRAQANKPRLLQESFCTWKTAGIWYHTFNRKTRRWWFSRNRHTLSKHNFFVHFLISQSCRCFPVVLALKSLFFKHSDIPIEFWKLFLRLKALPNWMQTC